MCGRATLTVGPDELRKLFGLEDLVPLAPRFNIAPSQLLAVIREPKQLELLQWGLWISERMTINVRAESVARAPKYRAAFRSRRCLVIVDGFYEWQRRGKAKQPFLVRRDDGHAFALAGIWEPGGAAGQAADACAIITGQARDVVAQLHDRMPIVVAPEHYARWLDPREWPTDLLAPDAASLTAYPVSTLVNSPANDDARLLEPVELTQAGENLELFPR